MNKKQLAEKVIKAVRASGKVYTILDGDETKPRHIRIDGWGDVWPSTSTFRHGKKWYRRNYKQLCALLSVSPEESTKRRNKSNTEIETRIKDLEEYCAFLEQEIDQIKTHLVI